MIEIDGRNREIPRGLTAAGELYRLADCGEKRLFLNRRGDIGVPLFPSDHAVVRGGEVFVTGARPEEDNPPLRTPVRPRFNGADGPALAKARMAGNALKALDTEVTPGRLFVDIDGGPDAEITDEMTVLVQDADSFFVIPAEAVAEPDVIDVEICGKRDRRPPKGYRYRIRIDREKHVVPSAEITGREILTLAGRNSDEWALNQKMPGGRRVRIEVGETIGLARPGVERFETVRRQAQQGHD